MCLRFILAWLRQIWTHLWVQATVMIAVVVAVIAGCVTMVRYLLAPVQSSGFTALILGSRADDSIKLNWSIRPLTVIWLVAMAAALLGCVVYLGREVYPDTHVQHTHGYERIGNLIQLAVMSAIALGLAAFAYYSHLF